MNERIKELAEQAGEIETINVISYDGDTMETVVSTEFNKEKFAELIVAECVNALETEVDSWKEMDPYRGSIKRLGTKAIKEHFGVEE